MSQTGCGSHTSAKACHTHLRAHVQPHLAVLSSSAPSRQTHTASHPAQKRHTRHTSSRACTQTHHDRSDTATVSLAPSFAGETRWLPARDRGPAHHALCVCRDKDDHPDHRARRRHDAEFRGPQAERAPRMLPRFAMQMEAPPVSDAQRAQQVAAETCQVRRTCLRRGTYRVNDIIGGLHLLDYAGTSPCSAF